MTITENKNELQINTKTHWKDFLKAIERFTDVRTSKKMIFDIFNEGNSVFREFPKSRLCAIFTLKEVEPVFDLKVTSPDNQLELAYELFNYLVDTGNIGIALDSASIINVNLDKYAKVDGFVLIVPLKMSRGVNGIVLVIHDNNNEDINQFLIKLVAVFANLLGFTIENYQILNEIEKSKASLEQKIATRTLDLAQSRRELKAIFESVMTGVIVFDLTINKIVRVNPVACCIIGLSDTEIIGRSVFEFLPYLDYSTINEPDGISNLNYFDSELLAANDKIIPVLRNTTKLKLNHRTLITESFVDVSKIKEAERSLTHTNQLLEQKVKERTEDLQLIVHKLKQEIIERENAESELRKLFEQQKELSDLKTRFVSMVSHEFRTPLTIIKSSAQMVTKFENKLSEIDKNYYIQRIIKSVDNLTDLIENVVFIGKNDSQKFILNPTNFNIKEFLFNIIEDFKLGLNDGKSIHAEIENGLEIVLCDNKLLHLIISNLISNSIKYSHESSEILIKVRKDDEYLIISIIDSGIGIPENELNNVFDLFYRAENVKTIGGTGLGLAVVAESLNKMNGKIEMQSKLNIGSTFTVFIPLNSQEVN
jgi:PAS domain S-box-containing protein